MNTTEQIKAIQRVVGTLDDGKAGPSTWNNFYKHFGNSGSIDIRYPYDTKEFGCYVITSTYDRVKPVDNDGRSGVGSYAYSMSGSFTYPSGQRPISIMVKDGVVISSVACHYWTMDKPEGVLYCHYDGSYGMKQCKLANELPEGVKWAVGGLTMIRDGKPYFQFAVEGFTGKYSDVKRTTAHNAIGFDKYGNVLGVYHPYCSLASFQSRCISLGMVDGISLDGGSVSAINTPTYKKNLYTRQGYAIQY